MTAPLSRITVRFGVHLEMTGTDVADIGGDHAHAVGVVAFQVGGDQMAGHLFRKIRPAAGAGEDSATNPVSC